MSCNGWRNRSRPSRTCYAPPGVEVAELETIDPALAEPRELLESAAIHAHEAAISLRHYLDGLDLDPAALALVEARLAQVHDLARKYRCFAAQIPELLDARRAELAALEHADQTLDELRVQRDAAWDDFSAEAARLSAARQGAAGRLSETVTQAMQQLGMTGGRFAVRLEPLAADGGRRRGPGAHRRSWSAPTPASPCSPWRGSPPAANSRASASPSRSPPPSVGSVPTLVFDEVDVGIGGGVAEIVGRLLRRLGAARQVLCVTHLPQVAAQAHQQLRVSKDTDDGETHTRIAPLAPAARVEEIARMLGGTEITQRTRDHATEMLDRAKDQPDL